MTMKTIKTPKAKKAETKAPVADQPKEETKTTFEANLKKYEEFQAKKKDLKAQIAKKEESSKKGKPADTSALQSELEELSKKELEWLKSVAVPLDIEFKKNGFNYKQLKKGEKACIYEVRDPKHDNMLISHEVFLLKVSPPKIAFKKPYDAYEVFPGNGSFGHTAWCIGAGDDSFERADKRFQALESQSLNIEALSTEEDEEEEEVVAED